jgi:hypothetical protein
VAPALSSSEGRTTGSEKAVIRYPCAIAQSDTSFASANACDHFADLTSATSAFGETTATFELETGTRMMKKAISILTFAASLAAGMMVLPAARDTLAKGGVSEGEFDQKIDAEFHVSNHRARIREARQLLEKNADKHKENTSGHKEDGPGIHRE